MSTVNQGISLFEMLCSMADPGFSKGYAEHRWDTAIRKSPPGASINLSLPLQPSQFVLYGDHRSKAKGQMQREQQSQGRFNLVLDHSTSSRSSMLLLHLATGN